MLYKMLTQAGDFMGAKGDVEDMENDLSGSVIYASIRSSMVMRTQPSMTATRRWCWSSRRPGRGGLSGRVYYVKSVTDSQSLLTNNSLVDSAGRLAQAARVAQDAPPFHFQLIESMPPAMTNQPRSTIIGDNPIGNGLDAVRASFNTVCTDALGQLDQEGMTVQLCQVRAPLIDV